MKKSKKLSLLLFLFSTVLSCSSLAFENSSTIISEKSENILSVDSKNFEYKYKRPDEVYNLLTNAADLIANEFDEDLSGTSRVQLCVTGHWPFNGCYEVGSVALECHDLLSEGESFPSGVTCKNI